MLNARPIDGRHRRLRHAANAVLVAILCGIPWIRIAGEPLVLLDVPARKFHVFGLVIFPQELYFLWLILISLGMALFFFTAVAGRLWCGWACPQTVFTDLFAQLARWIEGWRGSKRPPSVARWRRVLLHVSWIALSAALAFHLVAYFASPYTLIARARAGQLAGASAAFLVVLTALAYADFAFVRQTFCKYLCPYARFQGVLFDRDTLVIGYDTKRGEPRGKRGTTTGDCVDCRLCVQVCPSGIDIRNGLQLECIACTQCIDACDGVMGRLGRKRGLIAYRALSALEAGRAPRLARPRVVVYAVLLVAAGAAFTAALSRRVPMDLVVEHNREALYTRAADGRVGNSFTLHIENRARAPESFRVRLESEPRGFELVAGLNPIPVAATSVADARVFVMAPLRAGEAELRFVLESSLRPGERVARETRFIAPAGGATRGR
ncbi:MAG TPA: cytochrome c oxidase accessory protein CcoG [Myxococcota bacterium]|nr:cytochrome c oxidase accessory protein CcoG [Myxococcota bacterium]